jgi:hypothetical protein
MKEFIEKKQEEAREKLEQWIERHHGTVGWQMKLANLQDNLIATIIADTEERVLEEVKKYLLEEHIHYSSEPEDNWQFVDERPYVDSLELEKHFEALLTKHK